MVIREQVISNLLLFFFPLQCLRSFLYSQITHLNLDRVFAYFAFLSFLFPSGCDYVFPTPTSFPGSLIFRPLRNGDLGTKKSILSIIYVTQHVPMHWMISASGPWWTKAPMNLDCEQSLSFPSVSRAIERTSRERTSGEWWALGGELRTASRNASPHSLLVCFPNLHNINKGFQEQKPTSRSLLWTFSQSQDSAVLLMHHYPGPWITDPALIQIIPNWRPKPWTVKITLFITILNFVSKEDQMHWKNRKKGMKLLGWS